MTTRRLTPALLALATTLVVGCGSSPATKPDAPVPAATVAAQPPQLYDARAFFTTTTFGLAGGHAWSPDDRQLLVQSDETGIFNVYALDASSGQRKALTTSAKDSTYAVSWFPEDGRVLFTADQGGNELDHLYVREVSGETRDLTPGEKTKAAFAGWATDRQSFFVLTNERDPEAFDLYRYSARDYARAMVFHNDDALEIEAARPRGRSPARPRRRAPAPTPTSTCSTRTPRAPSRS